MARPVQPSPARNCDARFAPNSPFLVIWHCLSLPVHSSIVRVLSWLICCLEATTEHRHEITPPPLVERNSLNACPATPKRRTVTRQRCVNAVGCRSSGARSGNATGKTSSTAPTGAARAKRSKSTRPLVFCPRPLTVPPYPPHLPPLCANRQRLVPQCVQTSPRSS